MRRTIVISAISLGLIIAASAASSQDPRARHERGRPAPTSAPATGVPANVAANQGAIPDQGVHNPVHAAHQSQIVFTRSDLGIGAITEADIVSDFTLGQPMFFRVFTKASAVNAIAAANGVPARSVYADGVRYIARFTIDGQSFDTGIFPWGGRRDHETWTTWRGQFVNPGNAQRTPGTDAFLEMLSRATSAGLLKPGRHTVKMEVIPETAVSDGKFIRAGVVSSGSFNLTVPAGIFQSGNKAVCGPGRGGAGSAALEARAFSQAKQFWDWPDLVLVRAVAIGEAWDVERNEITGIPIERSTTVAIQARGPKYCTSHVHTFTEKYMGGGNFSTATGGVSVNFTPGYVPCGCLG